MNADTAKSQTPAPGAAVRERRSGRPSGPARGPIEQLIQLVRSETPVYVQLADQLRYLITTGEMPTGTRLPTARHLAQNLGINRNTVMSAYSSLGRDGYVRGNRRGGTRVISAMAPELDDRRLQNRLVELADNLVEVAQALGLTRASIGSLIDTRLQLSQDRSALRVGFVECNSESLDYFVGELRREFGISAVPILLSDLATGARLGLDPADFDCMVSTFYHLSEVRRSLGRLGASPELFAISVRPHLSVVEALERLPQGSEVGVAYATVGDNRSAMEERLRRMTEAVQHTGVRGLRVRPILVGNALDPSLFAGLAAVVVRPENIAAVRSAIPLNVALIEFVNILDVAAMHFLREVFADLAAKSRDQALQTRAREAGVGA